MCDSLHNPSELRYLWKQRGNKNYVLKNFISDGLLIQSLVFEDIRNGRKVLGKIVTSPREGEAYHWPRLQHENLAPLVDIVSINEMISIYIYPYIGRTLRSVIHDPAFLNDPNCFDRKKGYAEDILWALDYLHEKSLCLMNLTDTIIHVCDVSDKAVICDFSCINLSERATKDKIEVPILYQAPELGINERFDPTASEIWTCGVMMLQIFSRHVLPFSFIGDEVNQVLKAVKEMDYSTIKETNPGANLDARAVEDLKEFLGFFLVKNPKLRVNAKYTAISPFLTNSRLRSTVGDKYSRRLTESDKSFGYPWPSYQTRSNKTHIENNSDLIFKDIYLNEAAKCREKLKKLPGSNKFINLDFLQEEDISKNLDDKFRKSSIWIKTKALKTKQMSVEDAQSITAKNTQNIFKQSNNKNSCIKISNNLVVDEQFTAPNFVEKCMTIGDVTSADYKQKINLNNLNYPEILGDCCISYDNKCVKNSNSPLNVSLDSLDDYVVSNVEKNKNDVNYPRETNNFMHSLESNDNNQEQLNIESQIWAFKNPKNYTNENYANEIIHRSKHADNFQRLNAKPFPIRTLEEIQSERNQSIDSYQDTKISYTSFDLTTLNIFNSQIDRNPKFPVNPIFDRNCFTDELNVHFDDNIWQSCETIKPKECNSLNNTSTLSKDSDSNAKEQNQPHDTDCTLKLEIPEGRDAKQNPEDGDCGSLLTKLRNTTKSYSGRYVSNIQTNKSLALAHSYKQMISEMRNGSYVAKHDQHSKIRNYALKLEPAEEQGIQQNSKTCISDCPNKACQDTIEVDSGSSQSDVQGKENFIPVHSEKQAILPGTGKKLRIEKYDQYPNIPPCTTELETTGSTEQKSEKANSKTCAENKTVDCSSQVNNTIIESDSRSLQSSVQITIDFTHRYSDQQVILPEIRKDSDIQKHIEQHASVPCTVRGESANEQNNEKCITLGENDNVESSTHANRSANKIESDSMGSKCNVPINDSFSKINSEEQQAIIPEIINDFVIEKCWPQYSNITSFIIKTALTDEKDDETFVICGKHDNLESTSQVPKYLSTIKNGADGNVQMNESFTQKYSEGQIILSDMKDDFNVVEQHSRQSDVHCSSSAEEQIEAIHPETYDVNYVDFPSQVYNRTNVTKSCSESDVQINDSCTPTHSELTILLEKGDSCSIEKRHDQHSNMLNYGIKEESTEQQRLNSKTCEENGNVCLSQCKNSDSAGSESGIQTDNNFTETYFKEKAIVSQMEDVCIIEKYHYQHSTYIHGCVINSEVTEEQGAKKPSGLCEENRNDDCKSQESKCTEALAPESGAPCGVQINDIFTQTHSDEHVILPQSGDDYIMKRHDQHSNIRNYIIKVESAEEKNVETSLKSCSKKGNVECPFKVSKGINTIEGSSRGFETRVKALHSFGQRFFCEQLESPEAGSGLKVDEYDAESNTCSRIVKLESREEQGKKTYPNMCGGNYNIDCSFQISMGTNTIESNSGGFETRDKTFHNQKFPYKQQVLPKMKLKIEKCDDNSNTRSITGKLEPTVVQGIKACPKPCVERYHVERPFQISKGINTIQGNSGGFETRVPTSYDFRQTHSYHTSELLEIASAIRAEKYNNNSNILSRRTELKPMEGKDSKPYQGTYGESCDVESQVSSLTNMVHSEFEGSHRGVQNNSSVTRSSSYEEAILLGIENVNRQQIGLHADTATAKDKLTLISLSNEPHNSNSIDNEWKIYRDSNNSMKNKRNVLDKGVLSSTADTPILNFSSIATNSVSYLTEARNSRKKIKRKFFSSKWFPLLCLGGSFMSKKK